MDAAELTLDSVVDSEVLKGLPLVGWVVKTYGAVRTIRERFMLKKLYRFFERLRDMPQEERERAAERILSNPAEARKVGEAFLIWLDRLDDEEKAEMLGKVFELYAKGIIDFHRSARFASVIDRAHIPYLLRMGRLPQHQNYPHGGVVFSSDDVRAHLLALGLVDVRADLRDVDRQLELDRSRDRVSLLKFELNDDGRVFKEYVMDEMPVRTRISQHIQTPPKNTG